MAGQHAARGSRRALRRLAKSLDQRRVKMHAQMTGPYSLIDDETAELLFNEAETLAAAMQSFRERLLTRAATLDAMPPIRPEHEARTQTVGWLRLIFQNVAVAHVRDNEANLRGFVLACLDAGGLNQQSERTPGPAAGDVAGQGAAADPRLATDAWRAGVNPTPFTDCIPVVSQTVASRETNFVPLLACAGPLRAQLCLACHCRERDMVELETRDRFLREAEVALVTSLSRAQRWRLELRGDFPARIRLGGRTVVWSAREIEEWMKSRPRARYAPRGVILGPHPVE